MNDNIFAILGVRTIKIFSRPQVLYVPPITQISTSLIEGTSKTSRKKWVSKKEKAAAAAAAILAGNDLKPTITDEIASVNTSEKKFNEFTPSGKLNIFQGNSRKRLIKYPTILRMLSNDKILIGFDDGSVQVMYSPVLLDPSTLSSNKSIIPAAAALQISLGDVRRSDNDSQQQQKNLSVHTTEPAEGTLAAVLCEFQAHYVADLPERPTTAGTDRAASDADGLVTGSAADDLSEPDLTTAEKPMKVSTLGVRSALACPWGNCNGGPGLGYQLEILTVGSDRRIAHWGIRYKPGQCDVVLVPHYSSTTRATTAQGKPQMLTDEDDEPLVYMDSLHEGSCYSRPDTRDPSAVPMESDLLGVSSYCSCILSLQYHTHYSGHMLHMVPSRYHIVLIYDSLGFF